MTPDGWSWYEAADAFVLVSDVESLPRSVLEAMAFGLPVLSTDVFGLADVVVPGVTGIVASPRDLLSLETTLRELLSMSGVERKRLGAAGRSLVREHYDSRGYVDAYRRLLCGLAAEPGALPGRLLGLA